MVFPDLMAMVDCWGFRTLPGPALSASDKRASPESFSKRTGKVLLLFFFSFISLVKYRFTAKQRKRNRLPELQSRASGVKRERCIIHIKFYMYEIINLGRSTC